VTLERARELIERDIALGYVGREGAARDYGDGNWTTSKRSGTAG